MAQLKKPKPMKRITVTVDPDDYEAFSTLAQSSDVTASWLIRRAMREFLERHKEGSVIELTLGDLNRAV